MKLWKNIKADNKVKKDNKTELKLLLSDNQNPINKSIKDSKEEKEKRSESSINFTNNFQNQSYSSISEEEKNITKSNFKKQGKLEQLSHRKLITSSQKGKFKNNKFNNNIKTIYPKIQNKNSKTMSRLYLDNIKYGRNRFKLKMKKTFSPLLSNNTILNKWRDDFHKLFSKSIRNIKTDFSNAIKYYNKSRNRLKNNMSEQKLKKQLMITDLPFSEKKLIEMSNNKENSTLNLYDNNEINSDRKKYAKSSGIQLTTSPYNTNNFSKSNKKYLYKNEQYSSSSFSSKTLNKFEVSKINNKIYKNYKRKRTFKEYMKESNILNFEWKKKIGILDSEVKYTKTLLNDIKFQSNTIKDELNLLIDGVHYYKMRLFGNNDLMAAFMNKDIYYQINLNKNLEEVCALLHLVPRIILKEYYMYTDRFISIPEPGRENFITKIITNESECLNENVKLLYKIINFVKSCFEVYLQLVSQIEEEMLIQRHDFEILREIFKKCRYYIGNLINFGNNILKDYSFDKELIQRCKPILDNTKERLKNNKRFSYNKNYKFEDESNKTNRKNKKNENYFNYKNKFKISKKDNISDKMNSNMNFKDNELSQKLLRITKALETGGDIKNIHFADKLKLKQVGIDTKNGKGGPMSLVFSPLMTKMLKYIRKDIREKIIALRSSEKYIEPKDE